MLTAPSSAPRTRSIVALESFHRDREKLLSAVCDRLDCEAQAFGISGSEDKVRVAKESANIFIEHFYVCGKYDVPQAMEEYLHWLRNFLARRQFPPTFIASMMRTVQRAAQAFLPEPDADWISAELRSLRIRERGAILQDRAG